MSKIEWCDETINPIIGCNKVSSACDNCYAQKMAFRLASMNTRGYDGVVNDKGQWTGKLNFVPSELEKPSKWKKHKLVFIGSMTDIFHENVQYEWLHDIFMMIAKNPQHTFIILSKREEEMEKFMNSEWYQGIPEQFECLNTIRKNNNQEELDIPELPLKNLIVALTITSQDDARKKLPLFLSKIPAYKRAVSVEPLISELDLHAIVEPEFFSLNALTGELKELDPAFMGMHEENNKTNKLDWVIVGGETGIKANTRKMKQTWVYNLYKQCLAYDVPFFFKQWGTHKPSGTYEFEQVKEFPIESANLKKG